MKSCHRRLIVGAIALTSVCGTAVPCGTPPQPPPPPPSPPIVYCSPVRWIVDPTNPNFQCPIPPPCVGDLNGDGFCNTLDLTIFLGNFGAHCP